MRTVTVIIGLILLTTLVGSCMFVVFRSRATTTGGAASGTQSQESSPAITIDKSEEAQAGRWELINALCGQGVFKEVKDGAVARVVVGPGFGTTNFVQRQSFAEVVWAACYDAQDYNDVGAVVSFVDPQTDKELGTYHPQSGLRMN